MTHPQFWPISILRAEKFPLGELPISFAMNHFIMFHTIQDNPRHLRGPITGSVVSTTFGKLPWLSLWRPTRWTDPPANGSCSESRGLESCSLGSNHRPKDQAILIDWLSHGKFFKICVEIWYMWSFNVIYPTNWDVFLGIMAWCSPFVNAVRKRLWSLEMRSAWPLIRKTRPSLVSSIMSAPWKNSAGTVCCARSERNSLEHLESTWQLEFKHGDTQKVPLRMG